VVSEIKFVLLGVAIYLTKKYMIVSVSEWKWLYVRATQKGYIRTRKAQKQEK